MNSSRHNADWIDGSVYPDQPVPERLETLPERVDYLVRVCGAWDFGILPKPETLERLRSPDWRVAIEQTEMLTSCAYHLLREFHGLPPARYLGPRFPEIENDPCLSLV
jgi:hypothetical protein